MYAVLIELGLEVRAILIGDHFTPVSEALAAAYTVSSACSLMSVIDAVEQYLEEHVVADVFVGCQAEQRDGGSEHLSFHFKLTELLDRARVSHTWAVVDRSGRHSDGWHSYPLTWPRGCGDIGRPWTHIRGARLPPSQGPVFRLPNFEDDFLLKGWAEVGAERWTLGVHSTGAGYLEDSVGNTRRVSAHERAKCGVPGATLRCVEEGRAQKRPIDVTDRIRHEFLDAAVWLPAMRAVVGAMFHEEVRAGRAAGDELRGLDMPSGYEEVFTKAKEACPYLIDRSQRGLDCVSPLGPGWEDQWAHLATKGASWTQCKADVRETLEHRGLLPRGLTPSDHALCAAAMRSPFADKSLVADDLEYACRITVMLGEKADEWREQKFKELKALAEGLKGHRQALESARGFASARVSSHIRLDRLDLTRYGVAWPDSGLASMVGAGATVTGELPYTGIYRAADVRAALDLDTFNSDNDEWVTKICKTRPPDPEQAQVIWQKSKEEVEAGLLRGFWTKEVMDTRWGRGQWRCLVRFAIWQSGAQKYRLIDNGRTGGHNATLSTNECIHTATVESGAAMMACLRRIAAAPLVGKLRALSSTQDMRRAFRQLGVRDEDRRYHIIALYEPGQGWRFGELDGLAFGLGAAVLEFNRVPEHVCAVARRWLALPVTHFYDDFRTVDIAASAGSVDRYFADLCAWLGWQLDPSKHQVPETLIKFLGVMEELLGDGDNVTISLSEEKRLDLLGELQQAIVDEECPQALMAHIVGRLVHYSATIAGRIGLGMLTPLAHFAAGDTRRVDHAVVRAVEFYQSLLRVPRSKTIPLLREGTKSISVISDASWADLKEERVLGRICFINMAQARDGRYGGVLTLREGDKVLESLYPRKTQIIAAELLGPLLALAYCGPALRGAAVTMFVDNLSALCAVVKGGSRRGDLACVATGIQYGMHWLDVRGWMDYVESESNLTDGGSRIGTCDPLAAALGVTLREITDFALPAGFPEATPDEWHRWWKHAYAKACWFARTVEQ